MHSNAKNKKIKEPCYVELLPFDGSLFRWRTDGHRRLVRQRHRSNDLIAGFKTTQTS